MLEVAIGTLTGYHNIEISDDILGNSLSSFDRVLLSETWATNDDVFEMEWFTFHYYARQMKHCDARRNSGGLGIFI